MQTFELKFEIVTTITELKHTGLTVIFTPGFPIHLGERGDLEPILKTKFCFNKLV